MTESIRVSIVVNGRRREVAVDPRTLLSSLIREHLDLLGTKVACDTSSCGSCTVLLDGESVKSCTVLAVQADGREVLTIEGLSPTDELHPVQEAFRRHQALQCGFCTPGMVMATVGLLAEVSKPTEEDVRRGLSGNLCRCTGYEGIVRAVLDAAGESSEVHP